MRPLPKAKTPHERERESLVGTTSSDPFWIDQTVSENFTLNPIKYVAEFIENQDR